MNRHLVVQLSVPEEHYTEALRVFDTLEYLLNHRDPNLLFVGLPVIPGASMHVIGDEVRKDVNSSVLPGLCARFNSNIVMLRPLHA